MKSILLSIRPEWVAKILNGEKIIEIRKKFPKEYIGWVYIYCTKSNEYLLDIGHEDNKNKFFVWDKNSHHYPFKYNYDEYTGKKIEIESSFHGKVLGRFWCNKIEEIKLISAFRYCTESLNNNALIVDSQLTDEIIDSYLKGSKGYAIHISKLEIFDKPKKLKELNINKAPQNYCYIEGE